ncbi:MAG: type II 3-dehydroquinate dehydratase [Dehalococcoidia bacterium]|jgi:3-dehydroquinate dehydratase-2|nr:type II 3-dehydroquinate dehydratase [Chloroflexota bacterium]MCH2494548.1 type II 3-dehydroquinate dehydratase [Dehalococcoidia bacterium]MQF84918.1 type II 3-dehydroquinate dehydratase [SAR202 cluster bacterium]MEC7919828.1 type II 3-dehydroquinate dehydratase [Chloroflexota bacterium]MEC9099561.1 type II 3-dehydroquinate dehydratase [Chloroflexota bacterium]|tara:strand:- start:3174 stop:3623 length:450 start_codon:yes stop_codon:yes gene_type:complete
MSDNLQILVINGPNLNMLGKRETDIYGTRTLDQITSDLEKKINDKSLSLDFFQSNHEGEILDFMHKNNNKVDGCIINAGALTHSSTALHDAIKSVDFPCVEVHMSNIYSRKESWRQKSLIAPAVIGTVQGFGEESYKAALELLVQYIRN